MARTVCSLTLILPWFLNLLFATQLHLMVAIAPSRAVYFVIFFTQAQGLREKAAGLQCRKVAHSAVLKRRDPWN